MSAIEPYRPAPVAGTFRYATTDVLADVRIVAVERRRHCVTYEMVIVNRKAQTVYARLMGYIGRRKKPYELGSLEVTPDSAGRARIIVPLPRRGGELERVDLRDQGPALESRLLAELAALLLAILPRSVLRHQEGLLRFSHRGSARAEGPNKPGPHHRLDRARDEVRLDPHVD